MGMMEMFDFLASILSDDVRFYSNGFTYRMNAAIAAEPTAVYWEDVAYFSLSGGARGENVVVCGKKDYSIVTLKYANEEDAKLALSNCNLWLEHYWSENPEQRPQ